HTGFQPLPVRTPGGGADAKTSPGCGAERANESPEQTLSKILERFTKKQREALAAACQEISSALDKGARQFHKRSNDGGGAAAIIQLDAVIDFIEAFELGDGTATLPLQSVAVCSTRSRCGCRRAASPRGSLSWK